MIHAALHNKLSCLGQEDPLTAAVFGRLKYLSPDTMAAWLAKARAWGKSSARSLDDFLASGLSPTPIFWPQWPDALRGSSIVEPDVVLSSASGILVVEAKLGSGKSSSVFVVEEEERPADQLARQWKSASSVCRNRLYGALRPAALLYLTAHLVPPARDLDESFAAMEEQGDDPQLFWLSWSALEAPLRDEISSAKEPAAAIASDILAYLDEAGVLRFHGWRSPPLPSELGWHYTGRAAHSYWEQQSVAGPVWRYQAASPYSFVDQLPAQPTWTYARSTSDGH